MAAVSAVDRFFEFSLLGLLASGYLAVAGSGYLDLPTLTITAASGLAAVTSTSTTTQPHLTRLPHFTGHATVA